MHQMISVVVPVFNGAKTLEALFTRTQAVMQQLGYGFKMVFVDDCSPDDSWKVICRLKEAHPEQVKAIKLARNTGQHNATLCGIHHCEGDLIITIDDDLQIPPEEIAKLLEKHLADGADLVYGVFKQKKHSFFRNIGSWLVNKFFSLFANTYGNGSSFRLITNDLAVNLKLLNHRYLLLDEVLSWYTNNISSVMVEHKSREGGRSGYNLIKLIFMTINYVISYTVLPLRFMTYLGIFGSLITFALGLAYIYEKFFNSVELGFTSLIVAIFFSTSLILFSLGIIGEYVSRLFVKEGVPNYTVKEVK